MFYADNTHIGIIDRETFDKVQSLRQERNARFCRETELNTYPLTSRMGSVQSERLDAFTSNERRGDDSSGI